MQAKMIFHEKEFEVIMIERENLILKKAINHNILRVEDTHMNYHSCFEVKKYRLYLRKCEKSANLMIPNTYSGSIVIGRGLVTTDYQIHGEKIPCYSYKEVLELIFSQGIIVTAINHSKAMKRVRMNLDGGYRTLSKKKDVRCIERFLRDSFVGLYRERLI